MADKKYYVQERKSLSSPRGIKGPGEEVFSGKDFSEKNLKNLVDKKIIGTEKPDTRTKAEIVKEREEARLAKKTDAAKKAKAEAEAKDKKTPPAGAEK